MDYYKIIEVHPKEGTKHNPLHDKINGKRCRNRICPLNDGSITIEVDFENEDWHVIRTSTVLNMYKSGGMYFLETENTNYIFTLINEEEEKNEV